MLSRYGVFVCILFLFSALTACDSVDTEDMLTEQEVDALFTAIGTGFLPMGANTEVDVLNTGIGALETMDDESLGAITIDTTYACSGGGITNGQATYMPVMAGEEGIALNYDLSLFPSGCVVTVDDLTFTLDSESGIRQQGMLSPTVLETDNGVSFIFNIVGTTTGMLDWNLGDRSGACEVDLSTDARIELIIGSDPDAGILIGGDIDVGGGTSGMLCDIAVEQQLEVDIDDLLEQSPDASFAAPGVAMSRRLLRL